MTTVRTYEPIGLHLSFVGNATLVTLNGRSFTLDDLKARDLVSTMDAMMLAQLRARLVALAGKVAA